MIRGLATLRQLFPTDLFMSTVACVAVCFVDRSCVYLGQWK